jgi:hypothetical protein
VIEIGSGHLIQAGMKILISNPGFGHSECGMQQPNIANAKTPPISLNLVGMDLETSSTERNSGLAIARPAFLASSHIVGCLPPMPPGTSSAAREFEPE